MEFTQVDDLMLASLSLIRATTASSSQIHVTLGCLITSLAHLSKWYALNTRSPWNLDGRKPQLVKA